MLLSDSLLAIYFLFGLWLLVSVYETVTTYHFVKNGEMTFSTYLRWRIQQVSKSFIVCILISVLILLISTIFS